MKYLVIAVVLGELDVAVISQYGVAVMSGSGTGALTTTYESLTSGFTVGAIDSNADGKIDLITSSGITTHFGK